MTIRRQPEDFIVVERLSTATRDAIVPAWSSSSSHVVFEVTKTSRTTPEVSAELAKAIGARGGEASYAGLKDKHARTTQFMTVPVKDEAKAAAVPESVEGRQWTATRVGWIADPIEAPAIDGNRFEIVVRSLARETCDEMNRRAGLLLLPSTRPENEHREWTLLVTNYFGAQRFGSARHGEGFVARHLLRGEFEEALKLSIATPARKDAGKTRIFTRMAVNNWGNWKKLSYELPKCAERAPIEALAKGADFKDAFSQLPYFLQSMYVEALQSHWWNRTAHRLAERIAGSAKACLRSDDEYGEMLFPPSQMVLDASAPWKEVIVPVLGPETEPREPWKHAAIEILKAEGLTIDSLRIPGLRRPFFGEAPRPLFTRASEFSMSSPKRDELSGDPKRLARLVSFELPRGSYATVVLRALGQ